MSGNGNTLRRRAVKAGTESPDRLPPHSPEAEAGVIGCVLLEVLTGFNTCEERGLEKEAFYDLRYAVLWHALASMVKAGLGVDLITLQQWLKDRALLEQVGGLEFLSQLPDQVPSAANLTYYLEIVLEKWLLRRMVQTCAQTTAAVYELSGPTEPLLARFEREVLRLRDTGQGLGEVEIRLVVDAVLQDFENYHRGGKQMRGLVDTGLSYLDKMLCGLGGRNGKYNVVSGRPGAGKSSFAFQVAGFVAMDFVWWRRVLRAAEGGGLPQPVIVKNEEGEERFQVERVVGKPVGIFSMEMEREVLVQQMLFARAEGDIQRWRTGCAKNADLPPLMDAAAKVAFANRIWIDDESGLTIDRLKAKARRMRRQHGIELFVLDYIQLLRSSERRGRQNRNEEMMDISAELLALTKELGVPWLILAQMNREHEKEGGGRPPRLSDLRDCGGIEQDAHLVLFLYKPQLGEKKAEQWKRLREAVYGKDWSQKAARVNALVAKNRYGLTGPAELLFQKSCTRFYDYGEWLKEHEHFTGGNGGNGEGEKQEELMEEG